MFVMFATPCLSAKVEVDFFYAYLHTSKRLREAGIDHALRIQSGIAFIDHARNILCHNFLHDHPEATDLFFIDDDVGWHSDAVMQILNRTEDVVGAAYPFKQDDGGFPVDVEVDARKKVLIEKDGLVKASFLPTGFMRIKRSVIERMAAVEPAYPHNRSDGVTDRIKNIFHTGYYDGQRWGEDVDFANRWRAMGGEMWLDPNVTLSHAGRKRWYGRYADYLPRLRKSVKQLEMTDGEKA